MALAIGLIGGAASAQDNTVIGPPQLKDFQLEPRERIVVQPEPQQQPPQPAPQAADPEPTPRPRAETPPPPAETPTRPAARPAAPPAGPERAPAGDAQRAPLAPVEAAPVDQAPPPAATVPPAAEAPGLVLPPATTSEAPSAAPEPKQQSWPLWPFLAGGALVLVGLLLWRRRRNGQAPAEASEAQDAPVVPPPAPVAAKLPATPAPAPAPLIETAPAERPWIELELVAKRASFTEAEANVQFELAINNTGPADARNLRVDVKMLNAGAEQDTEIDAFFETAGRLATKVNFPQLPAGKSILIDGEVGMPHAEMRALQLNGRLLFIPVMAVNVLYEWSEAERGQTSRSFLIGREPPAGGEKMGPFHIDQGPRIWRSVDQRSHRLERRR